MTCVKRSGFYHPLSFLPPPPSHPPCSFLNHKEYLSSRTRWTDDGTVIRCTVVLGYGEYFRIDTELNTSGDSDAEFDADFWVGLYKPSG